MAKANYIVDWSLVQTLDDIKVLFKELRADNYRCEPTDLDPGGRYEAVAYLLVPDPVERDLPKETP